MKLCDFCLERLPGDAPTSIVIAKTRRLLVLGIVPIRDDGEWFCCAICHELIQAGQWEDLLCRFFVLKIKRGDLVSCPTEINPQMQTVIAGWSAVFGNKFHVNPLQACAKILRHGQTA